VLGASASLLRERTWTVGQSAETPGTPDTRPGGGTALSNNP